MAGKIVSEAQKDNADMNMTPMIDCVFQLIIFFMVVTEIKKSDDADVQLPRTRYVEKDDHPPKNRVVINCVWKELGRATGDYRVVEEIKVRNKFYNKEQLQALLERLDREERVANRMNLDKTVELSKMYIKIRADARCEWKTVQMAQMACTMAGVWQVSYGTEQAKQR